jgi:hypothetical protein
MCSIPCWILFIWEALGWKFCIFVLIHALPTRGRSLSLKWLAGCIYKVFRWFLAISGLLCAPVWPVEVTGLTGWGHWFDRSECWSCAHVGHRSDLWWCPVWPVWAEVLCTCWAPVWPVVVPGLTGVSWSCCSCPVFQVVCMHSSRGRCIGSGGAYMCVGGSLCGFYIFVLVVCALCLSFVLSRMCRAIALA